MKLSSGKMTKEELILLIDSWENMTYLVSEISKDVEFYNILMDIALYDLQQKSWRAAYLIDLINDEKPELLRPFLSKMTNQLLIETNESKRRHFLKLLSQNELTQEIQGLLFDFCLKIFSSSKEPVAVRVHAMQVLFNISISEPVLIPEVVALIEHEMEYHPTPGILTRGRRLITILKKK